MSTALESVTHVASIVASVAAIFAPAAAGLGMIPRAGPLRALVLGVSSKWRRPVLVSQRTADCLSLKTAIGAISTTQYVVVVGPKVSGKTDPPAPTLCSLARARSPLFRAFVLWPQCFRRASVRSRTTSQWTADFPRRLLRFLHIVPVPLHGLTCTAFVPYPQARQLLSTAL